MINVPGYRLLVQIHESIHSMTFRGQRVSDGFPVVVKVLKDDYPPIQEVLKYEREFEIMDSLRHLSRVVRAIALERVENRRALIMEDTGAEALLSWVRTHAVPLERSLSIAIEMTTCIAEIHGAGVVHKDVNPANFIFKSATGEMKIIDFGIATPLARENPGFDNPEVVEGTLAYCSPEQTGRLQASLDYRTDYYALGVTLYQMFTGRLPFDNRDPYQLIHAHLTVIPPAPHELDRAIPQPVSAIIMKLMAKLPEERYQTAQGILHDLEGCQRRLRESGEVGDFAIGAKDHSGRLIIPEKLYGRDEAIQAVKDGFERTCLGQCEMIVIAGYSGVGKTALVRKLFPALTEKRGFFISGKYEELQRDRPYSAIMSALRGLIRQLASKPGEQLLSWKEKILAGLGRNGQVMMDVLPELEGLIGAQPPLPQLPPEERKNRFNIVFHRFLSVFARAEHPLVFFLDDLQWADRASLKLLNWVMMSPQTRYVYVIGAYRDNEVGAGHPLKWLLDDLAKENLSPLMLALSPLSLGEVAALLADALGATEESSTRLAEVLQQKTGGNPFFVKEYLHWLHDQGLISREAQMDRWTWDLLQIQSGEITENVAELLAGKIKKMDPRSQEFIEIAACLGNQTDLTALCAVMQIPAREAMERLAPLVEAGLICPSSGRYGGSASLSVGGQDPYRTAFKFVHDRVHQAAYSLLSEEKRARTHLSIGRRLQASLTPEERATRVFEIVYHLLEARDLITSEEERIPLAALLWAAGQSAKRSAAFDSADHYLSAALDLVGESWWQVEYDFMLSLHSECAEAAYLCRDDERMERMVEIALQHTRNLLDQIHLLDIRIQSRTQQDKLQESVQIALQALSLLGVEFPKKRTVLSVGLALVAFRIFLVGKKTSRWLDLQDIQDPAVDAALRLIVSIGSASYLLDTNLYVLLVLRSFELSVRHGNSPYSSVPYTGIGVLLCGIFNDVDRGNEYGKLALDLVEKYDERRLKNYVLYVVSYFILHWKKHLRESVLMLRDAFQSALETGNLVFVGYSVISYLSYSFFMGLNLQVFELELSEMTLLMQRLKRKFVLQSLSMYQAAGQILQGKSSCPPAEIPGFFRPERFLIEGVIETENVFEFLHVRTILCCYFHHDQEGVKSADEARKVLQSALASFDFASFFFYDSLVRLGRFRKLGRLARLGARATIAANQRRLKKWARHAPMNHLHRYLLVEAERHALSGRAAKATLSYERAIAQAREQGFVHDEALSAELFGLFCLARFRQDEGVRHFRDARYAYLKWGAWAKVRALEDAYPVLLQRGHDSGGLLSTTDTSSHTAPVPTEPPT